MMATANGTIPELIQWNWLVMTENRSEYYCPPQFRLTNEEFCNGLNVALRENGLPASAQLVDVDWDAAGTAQRRILVRYTGDEKSGDILQLFVGVDQMGRFVYIETKSCIRPPKLPQSPRKEKPTKSWGPSVGTIAVTGVLGLILMAAGEGGIALGLILILGGVISAMRWQFSGDEDVKRWNTEAKTEQKTWDAAWEDWASMRLRIAYLKSRDDVLGRYSAAVMSTVNQVAKTLLIDRDAELRKQTEEQRKLEEIEQEMAKRRQQSMA